MQSLPNCYQIIFLIFLNIHDIWNFHINLNGLIVLKKFFSSLKTRFDHILADVDSLALFEWRSKLKKELSCPSSNIKISIFILKSIQAFGDELFRIAGTKFVIVYALSCESKNIHWKNNLNYKLYSMIK